MVAEFRGDSESKYTAIIEVAKWLGYENKMEYINACRDNPNAVKARIRRRAKKLGVKMPKLSTGQ